MKVLVKQKLIKQIFFSKSDNLNLQKIKNKFTFGGKLLQVFFFTKFTKFDISEYVKVSKKQRTNISEKKVKDVLQYCFLGYCFNFKNDSIGLNTSFSLRNVLDGFPIEMIFPLYSSAINCVSLMQKLTHKKSTRSKFYFLRNKSFPESLVDFDYVVRKKEEFKFFRIKSIKKLKK